MIKVTQCIAIALVAAASVSAHAGATDFSTLWVTPTIHDYGKIRLITDAAFKPQPGRTYKVVFSLTQAAKQTGEVNPALDRVARTVNLYVASGVPLRDLKFVAVTYGAVTPLPLDDAHYRAAYGVANPNLPLIA
jgi:hypothetical protein